MLLLQYETGDSNRRHSRSVRGSVARAETLRLSATHQLPYARRLRGSVSSETSNCANKVIQWQEEHRVHLSYVRLQD